MIFQTIIPFTDFLGYARNGFQAFPAFSLVESRFDDKWSFAQFWSLN